MAKKYWNNVCEMQKKQTEKGLATYGQTLEENTELDIIQRLEYLEEELIDGLMYIEHIKRLILNSDITINYKGENDHE